MLCVCCRGPLSDLLDEFGPSGRRAGVVKGELVLLVDGCSEDKAALAAMTAAAGQTPAVEPDGDQPGKLGLIAIRHQAATLPSALHITVRSKQSVGVAASAS